MIPSAMTLKTVVRGPGRSTAPIVDEIVRTRSTDVRHIEHTMDWMLGSTESDREGW